jgi:hypothetical protein
MTAPQSLPVGRQSLPAGLAALVQKFAPITLKEMDAVALLNRIDTKFVLTNRQLLATLAVVQQDYRVLSVNGRRLNHYRTLYFDTPDFDLYRLHVNGRADRYKVRTREYTDSSEAFLEVKHKTCKGRTIKQRIFTPEPVCEMTLDAESWLSGVFPYDSRVLEPKLWNTFTRITLVNRQMCERVTLDVDVNFSQGSRKACLGGLVIAEVKKSATGCNSPFLVAMREQRIQPRGFSKYVMGVSLLCDNVKKNALKPKLLWIEKMTRGM